MLTLGAITLVTFLGALFILVVTNIQQQVAQAQGQLQFEIYWDSELSPEAVKNDWARIRNMESFVSMTTYQPDQALAILAETMGRDMELDWLRKNNPLPPTALVVYDLTDTGSMEATDIYKALQEFSGVDTIHYNPLQIDLASSWTQISRQLIYPFVLFLLLLIGLIVGNTFKLAQMSNKEEIEVLRLVGAGKWYIQLPLLTGAAVQALVSGLLALGLLKLVHVNLAPMLNQPPLWMDLSFLSLEHMVTILAVLISVAVISGWVAVR
jgi:cell division transport system permease protein